MVYESRVPKKIFGPKVEEVTEDRDNFRMRSFMICTNHIIIVGSLNKRE
jgi:hypothetical protein